MCFHNELIIIIWLSVFYIQYNASNTSASNGATSKDESEWVPDGIVLDITLIKGQRVVTVRSPVQVRA